MNTERKIVEPKAIVVFDKIVKVSELNALTQGFDGDVIITKKLIIDKDVDITCNLHVLGNIVRKIPISEFSLNINGDLYCYGEILCNDINVSGYFYSEKIIYSRNIKVGENLVCDSKIDAFGCDIIVAGNLECQGLIAKKIRVLQEVSVCGSMAVSESIEIGY